MFWQVCLSRSGGNKNMFCKAYLPFYSQTELDLQSHRCIVNKQKSSLSSVQGFIDAVLRHFLHSSNNNFPKAILFDYNPKSVVRACADFVYCWAYCLPYSWRRSGLRQENKTGKMPTSKRKMNRNRWKQPKITGKRSNDRLGLTIHRLALTIHQLALSHKKAHPMPPSKGGWGGTMINF